MVAKSLKAEALPDKPDGLEDRQSLDNELALTAGVATYLGEQLQAFYARLMDARVPDQFIQLLAALDRQGSQTDGK